MIKWNAGWVLDPADPWRRSSVFLFDFIIISYNVIGNIDSALFGRIMSLIRSLSFLVVLIT